ncbi:MAG: hypothetical protein ACI87E_004636 [Mariniblastus sp.]
MFRFYQSGRLLRNAPGFSSWRMLNTNSLAGDSAQKTSSLLPANSDFQDGIVILKTPI